MYFEQYFMHQKFKRELQISVFPLPFVKINASLNDILILGLIVHHLIPFATLTPLWLFGDKPLVDKSEICLNS